MKIRSAAILSVFIMGGTVSACARAAGSVATGRPPVAIEVAEVRRGDLVEAVEVVGSLSPRLAADLKSEYSGIVSAVHVTE